MSPKDYKISIQIVKASSEDTSSGSIISYGLENSNNNGLTKNMLQI